MASKADVEAALLSANNMIANLKLELEKVPGATTTKISAAINEVESAYKAAVAVATKRADLQHGKHEAQFAELKKTRVKEENARKLEVARTVALEVQQKKIVVAIEALLNPRLTSCKHKKKLDASAKDGIYTIVYVEITQQRSIINMLEDTDGMARSSLCPLEKAGSSGIL